MNMNASFRIDGVDVETLIKALEGFPKNAKVSVSTIPADRWGTDTHELRVSWSK